MNGRGNQPTGNRLQLLFLALIAAYVILLVTDLPHLSHGARLFPIIIICLAGFFIVLKLLSILSPSMRHYMEASPKTDEDNDSGSNDAPLKTLKNSPLAVWLWVFAMVGTMYMIGFLAGMAVSILIYLRFMARESWLAACLVSLITLMFSYLVFSRAMRIDFDLGMLSKLLGI